MCYNEIVRRGSNTDPSGSVNERRAASAGNTPARVGTSKHGDSNGYGITSKPEWAIRLRPSRVRPEPIGFARLELLINGNRYKVRPTSLGSIAEVRTWRLQESRTERFTSSPRPSTDTLLAHARIRSSPYVIERHGASTCWLLGRRSSRRERRCANERHRQDQRPAQESPRLVPAEWSTR